MQEMMMSLASTKYLMYEKMHTECFGGKMPDLKKLSKLMSNEEIADWNSTISLVQREQDWTISIGEKSHQMLRDTKLKNEIKKMIKESKEKADSETIKQLKEMLEDLNLK